MFGIYYSVLYPLQNVLHIGKDVITKATDMMQTIPGVSSQFLSGQNAEMDIIKHFDALRGYLGDIFFGFRTGSESAFLSKGFHFSGARLAAGRRPAVIFGALLWLIRFCAWSSAWFSQFIMTRSQPAMAGQKGCMKVVMYALPLMSAYFAYVMPGAVGFYWIISTLTSLLATLVVNKFYSHQQLTAKMEAQRAALRYQEEAAVKELPLPVQRQLEEKAMAAKAAMQKNTSSTKKTDSGKKAKGGKKSGDSNAYLGSKK